MFLGKRFKELGILVGVVLFGFRGPGFNRASVYQIHWCLVKIVVCLVFYVDVSKLTSDQCLVKMVFYLVLRETKLVVLINVGCNNNSPKVANFLA